MTDDIINTSMFLFLISVGTKTSGTAIDLQADVSAWRIQQPPAVPPEAARRQTNVT